MISSFSYTVLPDNYSPYYHNYNIANYIALKIIPSNIDYLVVQFDVLVSFHKLNNEDYNLNYLKADTTYSFYMKISKFQQAKLSLEIDSINEIPFKFVNIYEYADNSYAYEDKENQTLLFSEKDNYLITSFSYTLKSVYKNTNCIYINIKPLLDINFIKIKKEIIGGIFELSTEASKNITNIKIGSPYYFSIKADKFQILTFTVVTDNINTDPFETVVFNEYDYRGIQKSEPIKTTQQKISFSSSNNQLISTFSYIVSKYWSRETVLNIINIGNLNYMNIKLEKENSYYDFFYSWQTIYYLKVGNKYYLDKHTYGQGINILYLNIIMDYIDNNPFEQIKVYEYEYTFDNDNKNKSIIKNLNIKTNRNGGSLRISASYKIIQEYYSGVVIELSPNYNISYLKIKYEGIYNIYEDPNFFIYILAFLAFIFLIIIIILVVSRICKCKSQNLSDSSIEQQQQNIVPIENL